MTDREQDRQPERSERKRSLAWSVYGQVMAAIGALSLLVLIGHFVDVGLKGVVRDAVQWWIGNVRPVVGAVFQSVIDLLPEAWRLKLSDLAKDYLAVGAVWAFSAIRSAFLVSSWPSSITEAFKLGVVLATFVVGWPVFVPFGLTAWWAGALRSMRRIRDMKAELEGEGWDDVDGRMKLSHRRLIGITVIFVAPFMYLLFILAANAWL